jgi:hypothetical protein
MNDELRAISFAKHQAMMLADAAFEAELHRVHRNPMTALWERYQLEQATPELTKLRDAYHQAADAWRSAYRAAAGIPLEQPVW